MEQLRITDTPAGPISYLLTRKRVKNLNLRVRNGQVSRQDLSLSELLF